MKRFGCGLVVAALAIGLSAGRVPAQSDGWTHRGRTSSRNGVAAPLPAGVEPPDLLEPRWVAPATGYELVGQGAPVVAWHWVFVQAMAEVPTGQDDETQWVREVLAFSVSTGELLWHRAVGDVEVYDSWSAPTVDAARGQVLLGAEGAVTAIHIGTGEITWQTSLGGGPIVNSSVCVFEDQAFIVDYTGFGLGATLYALNLDPNHPALDAGDVAWTKPLVASSGCEAAVDPATRTVIVTDSGGYLRQFTLDGRDGWVFEVPDAGLAWPPMPGSTGTFRGGCTVDGGRVYAATYEFYGVEDSARLYAIDVATGEKAWDAPCERTNSNPLVTGSLVLVSGGIDGYGSAPKVEAFDKADGTKLWQWTGAGGWTHQPIVVGDVLYTGTAPAEGYSFAPCTDLWALDLSLAPADPGFVLDHFAGAGSSPAFAAGNLYTIGAAGLHAFGPQVAAVPYHVEAEPADGQDWVYQNTPATTGDRHRSTVVVALVSPPWPWEDYDVTVAEDGALPADFTVGEARWMDFATLEIDLVGGRAGASTPTAPGGAALTVTVTGRESALSRSDDFLLQLRALGDVDGSGGDPTALDKQNLNKRLNGIATGLGDRAFDLNASGGEPNAVDKQIMNQLLNGVTIP